MFGVGEMVKHISDFLKEEMIFMENPDDKLEVIQDGDHWLLTTKVCSEYKLNPSAGICRILQLNRDQCDVKLILVGGHWVIDRVIFYSEESAQDALDAIDAELLMEKLAA